MKKNFTVIYKAYFTVGVEATSEEEAHGLSYEELIRTAFVEHPRNVVSDNNFEIESVTEEVGVLTSEIAETYIASDHGLIDLEVFKEIEDAAAESLSKYKGDFGRYGGLNGLTELSDAAAESLAKHEGELNLWGLTKLRLSEIQAHLKANTERLDAIDKSFIEPIPETSTPIQIPPPAGPRGKLEELSPELQKVLELNCIYMTAMGNLFTEIEQEWVDRQFGIGSSAHFARVIEIVNWDQFFPHIHSLIVALPIEDKKWIQANSTNLFRDFLECDGLDSEEEKQLNQLSQFIKHACSS